MNQAVEVVAQGTVMAQADRVLGYAAWPSVTRDAEGDLLHFREIELCMFVRMGKCC